ncbi:adenylate kinase [Actinoplanes regularis]|uniref:adenylate kinase n=1 Tax=Actinoplanes regularis TaxID=52697 RepID=UPI00249FA8E4|nr:adenylate kinase [Actinoplanes regularis]GLW31810.1 hypothetical protein Areg01_47490 [Actinoplanes regularis]
MPLPLLGVTDGRDLATATTDPRNTVRAFHLDATKRRATMPLALVAEDDPELRDLIAFKLRHIGYEVITAANGPAALAAATQRPDLALLDVRMPGVSGLEVCRRLRASPDTAELPIIMISADADVRAGLDAGADDYILKPFSPRELSRRVDTLMYRRAGHHGYTAAARSSTTTSGSGMRILMVSPPGAGKGTQGTLVASHFDIPHIATGDLLREHVAHRTPLGQAVQQRLQRGELVPDTIVLDMVREAVLTALHDHGGYVLDGVPRTMAQARGLYHLGCELGAINNVVLHLKADDAELVRRMLARAAIEHRTDDTEAVIRRRLALYHEVTEPLLDWYAQRGILVSVDAMPPAEQVGREILITLEAMRPLINLVPETSRRPVNLTGLRAA